MNTEVEKFADYLIEWITSKCDIELDRLTEFHIIRMIVDCVEMYENEELRISLSLAISKKIFI